MKRRDLCAVATFDADKGTQILTSFTSDRALLQHVITNLMKPEHIKIADPLRIAPPPKVEVEAGLMPAVEAKREGIREAIEALNARSARAHQDYLRGRLTTELRDLGRLARMIERQPGQKQVILLSEGFDSALVQGNRVTEGNRDEQQTAQDALDRGEIWKVSTEDRFGSSSAAFEIREMAILFKRSDVVLHAVDIRGLRGTVDLAGGSGGPKSSTEGLFLLTQPTGGAVFENATDLRRSFDEMLREQDFVYLLAFEARRTFDPGVFHQIAVKVPAARGGRVTHRAGYYEKSPYPESSFEQTLSLAGMLMTDVEKNEVPMTITATPLASQAHVPVMIEMSGSDLTRDGDENVVTADLYVYAFDMQNQIRDFLQQRLGVDLTRNGERLREGGLRYVSTLELPPGKYMLKALVRVDESGRIGMTRQAIEVPSTKLSATFLTPVKGGVNVAAPGRSEASMTAFGRAVPIAHPTLTGPVQLAVFGAGVDPDRARFAAPMEAIKPSLAVVEVADDRVLLQLDPAGLQPGEYTLLIEGVSVPFRVK
jgi:VWFA-related protein